MMTSNWKMLLGLGLLIGVLVILGLFCLCSRLAETKKKKKDQVIENPESLSSTPQWAPPQQPLPLSIQCECPLPQSPTPPPVSSVVAEIGSSLFWLASHIARDLSVENYANE